MTNTGTKMKKRAFDLIICLTILVLALPIFIVAALAVRLSSPGEIIFRQRRVGRGGRPFDILKFRTMRSGQPGSVITVANDNRITAVGAILRKWKLDELPQLLNVIRGEMSLVGPRPDVPVFVARYPEALRDRILAVRPGITDLASVKYRDEADLLAKQEDPEGYYREVILPDKLALAAAYADRPTLMLDLRIIFMTLQAIVVRK